MPVPTTRDDLNVTESLNSPAGSEAIGTSLDNYIRAHAAIIKQYVTDIADGTSATKGSDLVAFLQSGTGAVTTRSVQDKLREFVSRNEFDTDGNYNTAASSLSGRNDFVVRTDGGSSDRLISKKLGDFLSAKDEGAVGDGVTNDKTAIDAVNSSGNVVYLGGDTYAYTGTFSPVAKFVDGLIVDSNRTWDFSSRTAESAARVIQGRGRINYNTANSVRVHVPDQIVMAGFRFMGSYKNGGGRVMPSGATNGSVVVNDSTDLAVESSIHADNWYAVFAVCNDEDASVTYLNMPFFRAASVAGSVVTLGQGGQDDGDTATTTTYTGLTNNELVGAEVLVIQEGKIFSGRKTTVTANTDGTITLADIGSIAANDFFLVAPPGFDDYVYLASWYRDSAEPLNMADTGREVGSLGTNVVGIPATGEIAAATRYSLAGQVSPLATGWIGYMTYTINTASTGSVAHYFWHDSSSHVLLTIYDEKYHANNETNVRSPLPFQFSSEQAIWLSTAGSRDTNVSLRSLQTRGWIEP